MADGAFLAGYPRYALRHMGRPIWVKWPPQTSLYGSDGQMTKMLHNCRPRHFLTTSSGAKSVQGFRKYKFCKVCIPPVPDLTSLCPMGKAIWREWTDEQNVGQLSSRQSIELWTKQTFPVVSDICIPRIVFPAGTRFDNFATEWFFSCFLCYVVSI